MKKIYSLFLLALLPLAAYADAVEIDGIYYNLNAGNNTAEVTSNPNNYSGAVSIPATVTYGNVNYNVTSIGIEAFIDCSELTSVNIPNSVNKIEANAFWGCSSITHIEIPNGLTSIEHDTFYDCSGLVSVTIPEGVNILDEGAFNGCASLASVNLPNSLKTIGRGAFYGCALTSIEIPQNVTFIDEGAFDDCSSLTSIIILSKNITIGYALDNLPNLHELIIKADEISISFDGNDYDIKDVYCYAESDKIEWDGVGFRKNTKFHVIDKTNYKAKFPQAQCTFDDFPLIYDGIKYVISDNSAHVVANTDKYKGNLEIAASVELNSVSYPVVTIDNEAFYDCGDLSSIIIPNSVTHIGDYAFEGCFDLASLSISNNLISIGEAAFADCYSLLTLTIPNSTNSIAKEAFAGCSGLTSVTVENNTPITITSSVFSNIANATLYVPAGSKAAYQAADYWNEFKEIIERATPSDMFVFTANPDGITCSVTGFTDYCVGDVAIPESWEGLSVTSIGDMAFQYCNGLTSVTIPNSIISIGEYAFEHCNGLTSVIIPQSVNSIGEGAFANCSNLASLSVEIGNTRYDSRGGCNAIIETETNTLISGTKNTVIPNSVTSIVLRAFYGCSGLTSITIPRNVTSIENQAFDHCSGLASLSVEAGNTRYDSRGDCNAIIETETNILICGSKNTVIPNDVTSIGDYAFSGCSGLTSMTIPNSVISINEAAFSDCSSLTSVTIPNSVTYIGHAAFQDCGVLTSVTIPNKVTYIGNNAFSECFEMTSVTIPNTVTHIGNGAFYNYNLTSVTVEKGTPVNIKEYTFSNRANATLYVPAGCKAAYEAADYWKEFKEIIESEYPPTGTEVINGIYYNLKSDYTAEVTENPNKYSGAISIPATVTYGNVEYNVNAIGVDAFYNCAALTSVSIPNSVISIGDYAFSDCSGLTSVSIPSSVSILGEGAFSGCAGLTSVTIPNNVTSIRDEAFYDCRGLISVSIPNSVISIGDYAFGGCSGLTSVSIPSSVSILGEGAFSGCAGLTSVTIPNNVTSIGESAFSNCSKISSVSLPSEITSISKGTFEDCIGLLSITIPDAVTSIEGNAFIRCTNLTHVSLGKGIKNIDISSFFGCANITSLDINCKEIGNWFHDYDKLETVIIHDNVTSIGEEAFYSCDALSSFIIPNNVTEIGDYAFAHCSNLSSVSIGNGITFIGKGSFFGCSNLNSVKVQWNQPIAIEENVFNYRSQGTLYVPFGTKSIYGTADYWKDFKEIREFSENCTIIPADELFYGSNLWAGYVAQEDLILGYGLKAYVITDLGSTTATASEIDYMPQGVPVLLKRENASINSITIAPGTGTDPTTNLLKVYDIDKSVANREGFILYNDEFVLVNEGILPAGRIFLPTNKVLSTRGLTRSIVIDGDGTTGIEDNYIVADDSDDKWYDLQGRRLEKKPTKKGIYILNGRKVVVK